MMYDTLLIWGENTYLKQLTSTIMVLSCLLVVMAYFVYLAIEEIKKARPRHFYLATAQMLTTDAFICACFSVALLESAELAGLLMIASIVIGSGLCILASHLDDVKEQDAERSDRFWRSRANRRAEEREGGYYEEFQKYLE